MQKDRFWRHMDHENNLYSIGMHQNVPFFLKKRGKMAVFWSKIEFFGLRKTVEDPPPLF